MLRALVVIALCRPALADPPVASDEFPVRTNGALVVDGGLAVGAPAALPTGMAVGGGVGISVATGPARWGGRVAWLTATESSLAWQVTHQDLQLRAVVGVEHVAGRGRLGLQLGAGTTLVQEHRVRAQGARAGLMGDELETTERALVPAADLEATVGLGVLGPWLLSIAGGPSLAVVDGDAHWSWGARVGIGWQR
jgi:hypothetical protein